MALILGCITAEELKFVLTHLPGKVTYKEIDEMIKTVDENGDGKINYQVQLSIHLIRDTKISWDFYFNRNFES